MNKFTRKETREIMEVRGFSQNTIKIYINHLKNFAAYFNKPPHLLTPDHIHAYQVFLVREKQVSWSFFNQSVCALRFFLIMQLVMIGQSNIFHFKRSTKNCLQSFLPQRYKPFFRLYTVQRQKQLQLPSIVPVSDYRSVCTYTYRISIQIKCASG